MSLNHEVGMISAPTSVGELIDKITILEIKKSRITSRDKLKHVEDELAVLCRVRDESIQKTEMVSVLADELLRINETLWEIEDAIRKCESEADFGQTFIELARSVYKQNDKRSLVKRRLNEILSSDIIEEKSYAGY
jgi:hypothetical protein